MPKRGLCMASNYVGTSSQLAGCLNDAADWSAVLGDRSFQVETMLGPEATRQNMLDGMAALVQETGPDDIAVVTWSGHGTWRPDRDGDEADRRDEMICPDDYGRSGHIADDDLYRVFTSGHRWARVVFISDSCHSGSVNRLAGPLSDVWVPNDGAGRPERRAKFLPPAEWMDEDQFEVARRVELAPARGKPRASALLLAACTDTQVAYDAWFNGRANGAYTYAALQALAALDQRFPKGGGTYRQWQWEINQRLPSVDYDQAPRLEGGSGQRRWLALESEGER